jgi:hypothetical protein
MSKQLFESIVTRHSKILKTTPPIIMDLAHRELLENLNMITNEHIDRAEPRLRRILRARQRSFIQRLNQIGEITTSDHVEAIRIDGQVHSRVFNAQHGATREEVE